MAAVANQYSLCCACCTNTLSAKIGILFSAQHAQHTLNNFVKKINVEAVTGEDQ